MDPDSTLCIIGIILLSLLAAVFYAFKNAFTRLRDWNIEEKDDDREKLLICKICDNSEKYSQKANAIAVIFITIAIIWGAVFFFPKLLEVLGDGALWEFVATAILVVAALLINLGFVRGLSLALGYRKPEKFVGKFIFIYNLFAVLFSPFTFVFSLISAATSRLFGLKPDDEKVDVTEEEIRMLVDEGEIEEGQKEMINNVFEFDDITAGEIMTHRTDIVAMEKDEATMQAALDISIEHGYSRIPVFEEYIDKIVGIVYIKDLFNQINNGESRDFNLTGIMREPLFVPKSIRCRDLFHEMKLKKMQLAVVLDEYGGTSGIITMEDILESIVGNIQDEYDNEEEEISACEDGSFIFEGTIDLEEAQETLGFEIDEEIECDTLGGFVFYLLGKVPAENENPVVEYKNVEFEVVAMDERRIAKVRARVLEPEEQTEEETEE